jgi:hypothetical protein
MKLHIRSSVANQQYETSHYIKVLQTPHMTGLFQGNAQKLIFGKAFYIKETRYN